jgi:hypothetical protein
MIGDRHGMRTAVDTPVVCLIPGFFGFSNLAGLPYFYDVGAQLKSACRELGLEVEPIYVETRPTASLPERAARVLESIALHAGSEGPIHLIGHSSGGLDARLLATPGVSLPTALDVERYARRIRSVTCIATPQRGTPVASFFSGILGQRLLEMTSLGAIQMLRHGRVSLEFLRALGAQLDRALSGRLPSARAIREMHRDLVATLSGEQAARIESFLHDVSVDQGLLAQLSPDAMDLFNATTVDRPGVSYGCVLTRARAPGLRTTVDAGLDPYAQASHAIYGTLHTISSRMPRARASALGGAGFQLVASGAPGRGAPNWAENDGVVPTLSQIWGEVVHFAEADHLDVAGYFDDPSAEGSLRFDVFASASGFGRTEFAALWRAVAGQITRAGAVAGALSPVLVRRRTPARLPRGGGSKLDAVPWLPAPAVLELVPRAGALPAAREYRRSEPASGPDRDPVAFGLAGDGHERAPPRLGVAAHARAHLSIAVAGFAAAFFAADGAVHLLGLAPGSFSAMACFAAALLVGVAWPVRAFRRHVGARCPSCPDGRAAAISLLPPRYACAGCGRLFRGLTR